MATMDEINQERAYRMQSGIYGTPRSPEQVAQSQADRAAQNAAKQASAVRNVQTWEQGNRPAIRQDQFGPQSRPLASAATGADYEVPKPPPASAPYSGNMPTSFNRQETYDTSPERQSWLRSLGNGQTESAAANFRANADAYSAAQGEGGAGTPAIGGSRNPQLDMYNRMIQQNREDGDVGAKVGMIGGGLDAEMAARKAYIDRTSMVGRGGGRAGARDRALDLREQEAANAMQRAAMSEQGQMERLQFGEQGALRRAQLGERGAMARATMGEEGAMRRATMGEQGAMARARMGEEGALTRAGMQRMSETERLAAEAPYRQAQTGLVTQQGRRAGQEADIGQVMADLQNKALYGETEAIKAQARAGLQTLSPTKQDFTLTKALAGMPLGGAGQLPPGVKAGLEAGALQELQRQRGYADGGMVYGDAAIPGYAMGGGVRPLQYTNPTTDYLEKYYAAGLDKVLGPPSQGALAKVSMMQGAMQNPQTMGMGAMGFAEGGAIPVQGKMIEGPGTGTSDSVPAVIDGKYPAKLSNGEFVWTAAAANAYKGAAKDLKVIMKAAEQRDPMVIAALHKLAKVAQTGIDEDGEDIAEGEDSGEEDSGGESEGMGGMQGMGRGMMQGMQEMED